MSAEILRRAAALMRERAEAAVQQPWRANDASEWLTSGPKWEVVFTAPDEDPLVGGEDVAIANYIDQEDAEHIASWHPAVALAVADLLEGAARQCGFLRVEPSAHLLAVARAYLGEAS